MEESTEQLISKLPNQTNYKGKLIIFTSFYDWKGHAPYIQSMVATSMVLERLGIKWDFWPVFGDFHIERAVNEAYTRFLADPEATDILAIDSDESWDVMGILRLISHQEEVVGCSYRMKNSWERYTALLKTADDGIPVGKLLPDGTALIEAQRLPWGFLRIKKSALEKYRDAYPELRYAGREREQIIFCQQQYIDGQFFSQDFVFSERLKKLGIPLWCDPNVTIGHFGNTEYSGNLDKALRDLKESQESDEKIADAMKTVAGMAAEIEAR